MLLVLMLFSSSLIGCAGSNPPPVAVKGIDYGEWEGHPGGICLSEVYSKEFLRWKNHK